jgi:hypothetical protein
MSEYQVLKEPFPVKIILSDNTTMEGALYLGIHAALHEGHERVRDVLNQKEPFIPIRFSGGGTKLVHKDQLAVIAFNSEEIAMENAVLSNPSVHEVVVHLLNKGQFGGRFFSLLPSHARRVKDYLNQDEPFLELIRGNDIYLINKSHILYVEEK